MTTRILKFNPLLFSLLIAFTFSSCSSDDDSIENRAPNAFNLSQPADGAGDVEIQPQLSWAAATDPDGDPVTYQVYLDTQNPPQTSIANNLDVNTLSVLAELEPETTYYWMVVAKDVNNNTTESQIASFTSRDKTTSEAIVGKWFYESIEGQPALSECIKKTFFKFTNDLFVQIKNYEEESNGDCIEIGDGSGTYEVIGNNQIEITGNGGTQTLEIQSLTETELVLDGGFGLITFIKE